MKIFTQILIIGLIAADAGTVVYVKGSRHQEFGAQVGVKEIAVLDQEKNTAGSALQLNVGTSQKPTSKENALCNTHVAKQDNSNSDSATVYHYTAPEFPLEPIANVGDVRAENVVCSGKINNGKKTDVPSQASIATTGGAFSINVYNNTPPKNTEAESVSIETPQINSGDSNDSPVLPSAASGGSESKNENVSEAKELPAPQLPLTDEDYEIAGRDDMDDGSLQLPQLPAIGTN